jgi:hypothetical protein
MSLSTINSFNSTFCKNNKQLIPRDVIITGKVNVSILNRKILYKFIGNGSIQFPIDTTGEVLAVGGGGGGGDW